nr:MAG TPA: hypothetical protein [Caudoviricetes sp.]
MSLSLKAIMCVILLLTNIVKKVYIVSYCYFEFSIFAL